DSGIVPRLIAGLNNPAKEIQPAAQALRTLTQANHPDGYEVFQKYYEGATDLATRIEAARGLGRFDKGRAALRTSVLSPDEPWPLRLTALRVLNANDSLQSPAYALKVLEDETSPAEMRCFALSALAYQVAAAHARPEQPVSSRQAEITTRARKLAAKAK